VVIAANKLIDTVLESYKMEKKILRASEKHRQLAKSIAYNIVQNEPMEKWDASIPEYLNSPTKIGPEFDAISELAEEHGLNFLSASFLHHADKIEIV
jgi:hypothetical protein